MKDICVILKKKKKVQGGKHKLYLIYFCLQLCAFRTHELTCIHPDLSSSHFDVTAISPCPKNWQSTEKNHVQGRFEAQPVSVNKDAYKRLKSRLRWRPRTFRSIHPKENKDIFEKRRKVSFIF